MSASLRRFTIAIDSSKVMMRAASLLPLALLLFGARAMLPTDASARRLLEEKACPPPGFDALNEFDLASFISAPWYVQQQMPLVYQPEDSLYCVRAQYEPLDDDDLSVGLRVRNTANRGGVEGEMMGTDEESFLPLVAVPQEGSPAKLSVGPDLGFLPGVQQISTGDYWVVWAGSSKAESAPDKEEALGSGPTTTYDLAIISGGAPGRETDDGCATGSSIGFFRRFQTNNIGLWLFSREPVNAKGTEIMLEAAKELGLDTSVLREVQQEGCTYPALD